jgi:hypothetical protein
MADIRDLQNINYYNDSLPPQAIPNSRKGDSWKRATLDAFEAIGVDQISENIKFAEYKRMYNGNVSYMDFDEIPPNLEVISELRAAKELPTYFKHYDILGLFINTFVGEFLELNDKFRVSNTDPIAENEYLREKNRRIKKYIEDSFNLEFEKILAELKIDVNQKFSSEEEQRQFFAKLEQLRDENKPEQIERDMRTSWKTKAAMWGQHILTKDKPLLLDITRDEAISYMYSGRFFRHYRVGYDYYKPEKWNVEEVFFSKELDIEYPQFGEYVGRVTLMTPNQIVEKWGHLMTANEIEVLLGKDKDYSFFNRIGGNKSVGALQKQMYSKNFVMPFKGFDQYLFGRTLENMSGIPMGTRIDTDGSEHVSWIPDFNKDVLNSNILSTLRDDITIRTDMAQVTEVYWKSPKRIGLLTYLDNGIIKQDIVDDNILPEFIKYFGIKKVKTVTLEEAEKNPKVNTIVYTYVPEVRWGVKINSSNTFLEEDLYLGGEPTEFQIRGISDIYDVQLPVGGIISEPPIKKIIPLQILYNIHMNSIYKMTENALGFFYLIDWGILGSEYKDMDSTEEALLSLRDSAKELGFAMGDSTNDQYKKGSTMPAITPIDMSYNRQILEKFQIVDRIKWQALEQFGITPQRLGGSTVHETAEGVRQGAVASYNQTAIHFNKMENARNKLNEIHLAVAQYAQKNNKDISVFYASSDSNIAYLKFTDDNFQLRKLDIIATSDSKKARQLEQFKQAIFNTNTLGQDLLSFAETLASENISELIDVAKRLRERTDRQRQMSLEHESKLKQMELQAEKENKAEERAFKDYELTKKLQSEEKRAYIKNLGNAVDNNADKELIDKYDKLAKTVLDSEKTEKTLNIEQQKMLAKSREIAEKIAINKKKLEQKDRELDLREKQISTSEKIAQINKN